MIRRTISIDEDLWEQVKGRASYAGLSVSALIRVLLRLWMDDKIQI
jgi:predicted DNA binding CopG/RHH family protein